MKKKKKGMVFIPYDYEAAFQQNLDSLHELFVEELLKNRYKCVYTLKEITAGDQFEVEIYPEFTSIDQIPEEGRKKDNSRAQKNLNDKNARKYVIRLVNNNFTDRDIWMTLTYRPGEEPENMERAVKNMQNYIDRINYRRKKRGLGNARYIYITEYSPEAEIRWHHHVVMDGEMDMDTVEAAWTKGDRNQARRVNRDEFGLTGMSCYMTKEKNRKKNERRWNSSKNLKKFRVRKVRSKRPEARSGSYRKISSYINGFVKDRAILEGQVKKWYPDKQYLDAGVYYNDFNGMFYIHVRMRRGPDGWIKP